MATLATSASGTYSNVTTTLTVNPYGAYSPQVGDVAFIFLAVDSNIVVFTPGFYQQASATNTWTKLIDSTSNLNNQMLHVYYKTFNSADTTNVTFQFQPYVLLGVGDSGPLVANGCWSSAVFGAAGNTCPGAFAPLNTDGAAVTSFQVPSLLPANRHGFSSTPNFVYGCLAGGAASTLSAPDTQIQTVANGNLRLSTWMALGSVDGYAPAVTSSANTYRTNFNLELRDQAQSTFLYTPPVVDEGPAGDGPLFVRYKLPRHYTVINNTGTYSAQRWPTHDQLNNATKFWYNTNTATTSDRTAILSAGLGGDFRAYS